MFVPATASRELDSHKGDFGTVAVIGGDTGMTGAVLLAARAALYCGAGRIHAYFLAGHAPCVDICNPEIMLHHAQTLNQIIALNTINSVVIGTGLGQSKFAADLVELCIIQSTDLLLDADALNLLAKHSFLQNALKNRQGSTIITPHPVEAARLLNVPVEYVQLNRIRCAQKLANQFKVICVLKGAGTIIASLAAMSPVTSSPDTLSPVTLNPVDTILAITNSAVPDAVKFNHTNLSVMVKESELANVNGEWFINTTGNPSLASGGTGDALSGIIGSFVAQGVDCLQAAKLSVYVHGAAADSLVASGIGPVGLTASEIAIEVRAQINLLNKLALNKLTPKQS